MASDKDGRDRKRDSNNVICEPPAASIARLNLSLINTSQALRTEMQTQGLFHGTAYIVIKIELC